MSGDTATFPEIAASRTLLVSTTTVTVRSSDHRLGRGADDALAVLDG
jgi:hypothetical protein